MATGRQSKGFIELEWICPHCNSRNRGPVKTCENCGAPQPEDVEFYAPAEAKWIQDENVARLAALGPDIHCAFCGTRNPGNATVCSHCGADLKEGKTRQAGHDVKQEPAMAGGEVVCANCGEVNPPTQTMCVKCGAPLPKATAGTPSAEKRPDVAAPALAPAAKRRLSWFAIGGVVACLALIIGAWLLLVPSQTLQATVRDVYWQTSVPVQEMRAVSYSNEEGNPPAGAYDVSCHTETTQVCEEKTIDKGNGYAEVVQECHDEDRQVCSYTVDEWRTIQTYTLEGHDLKPVYASPAFAGGQRLGGASATYAVTFISGEESYVYRPATLDEFAAFVPGSVWTLHLNALGVVVSVER